MSFITFTGVSLCLIVSCVFISVSGYNYDHFVYTQQWAQSVCTCDDDLGKHETCQIPEGVKTWTIHGLWPTLGKTENPQYCNRSWHFEEIQILDIESKLLIYWPQLFTTNSRIAFWEHEWIKHGTCCTDLPSLNSEHKYFAVGLELNQKYDLLSMLHDAGILPSKTKTYELGDIRKAIANRLGHRPYIHCCKSGSKQKIQEVMICLDKQLKLIDCAESDENCSDNLPINYEPIIPDFIKDFFLYY